MLTPFLRRSRYSLRRTPSFVQNFVRSTRLPQLGLELYCRRILKKGETSLQVMGHRLRFQVRSAVEIKRIDSFEKEQEFVKQILTLLQPGNVVWDIGANIGLISILLAKKGKVTVHSFEPEPRNFCQLRKNIECNNLQGVVIPHQAALGARNAQVGLYVSGEVGKGDHSLVAPADPTSQEIEIKMITGAAMAEKLGDAPKVIKVDVEGAELDVIRGLEPLLMKRAVQALCIEVHPLQLARQGYAAEDIEKFLGQCGYQKASQTVRGSQLHEVFIAEKL